MLTIVVRPDKNYAREVRWDGRPLVQLTMAEIEAALMWAAEQQAVVSAAD